MNEQIQLQRVISNLMVSQVLHQSYAVALMGRACCIDANIAPEQHGYFYDASVLYLTLMLFASTAHVHHL